MRQFRRTDLRTKQRDIFAAAVDDPVGITHQGKLRHVLLHGKFFGSFSRMPGFGAEDFHRVASAIFTKADKGPVGIIVRRRDPFVLVSADYYQYEFLHCRRKQRNGRTARPD